MHRATAAAEAAAASVELALLCSVHNKEVHSCNRARVVCCAAARASSVEASAFFWEPPTGNGANKHKQLCATARNHERALSEYPPCTYVSRCYYGRRAHALCVNLCALRCRKRERERDRGGGRELQRCRPRQRVKSFTGIIIGHGARVNAATADLTIQLVLIFIIKL